MSGGRKSEWLPLQSGTPQGAVWSPMLWTIAIADIEQQVEGEIVCLARLSKLMTFVEAKSQTF